MENNNGNDMILFKESRKMMENMRKKALKKEINQNRRMIKHAPLTLKILSIFKPELAPVLKPLSDFLKSDSGKKVTEVALNNCDAMDNAIDGNIEEAKERIKGSFDMIKSEEGLNSLVDLKNFISQTKGLNI